MFGTKKKKGIFSKPAVSTASQTKMPNECGFCGNIGAGKGIDDYGHEHCRLCPYYNHDAILYGEPREREYPRSYPASGSTWTVYCEGNEMTVKAKMPEKNRDAPNGWVPPEGVFRKACRMITVVVGAGDLVQSFVVEEPLMRAASPYFDMALKNENFSEAKSGKFVLDDKDPEIFGLVNEYLHLGSVQQKWRTFELSDAEIDRTKSCNEVVSPTMLEWCRVWMLADYLLILSLKNHCMWNLHHMINSTDFGFYQMSVEEMEDIYADAPKDSILRKFLVHLCVWLDKNKDLELSDNPPMDMMRELVKELKRSRKEGVSSPSNDVRNYYESDELDTPPPDVPDNMVDESVVDVAEDEL